MKKIQLLIISLICLLTMSCAMVLTDKANLAEEPDGVRIFPPKTYLFVDTAANKTNICILPDYTNAYDIKPLTIVATQDFNLTINDTGGLSGFTSNQDTTSFIQLLQTAANVAKDAAKSGGAALTQQDFNGTFGLESGVYVLSEKGIPERIK